MNKYFALSLFLLISFSYFFIFEHEQSYEITAVQDVIDSENYVDTISFDNGKEKVIHIIQTLSIVCIILALLNTINLVITFLRRIVVLNPTYYQSNYLISPLLIKR